MNWYRDEESGRLCEYAVSTPSGVHELDCNDRAAWASDVRESPEPYRLCTMHVEMLGHQVRITP